MARSSLTKLPRMASHGLRASLLSRASPPLPALAMSPRLLGPPLGPAATRRFVSSTSNHRKGIMPETDDPKPKESAKTIVNLAPATITDGEYHQIANEYLEAVVTRFEELQDKQEGIDVEYTDGVLTLDFGPQIGTYVVNKQPPNKQIWLSSPKSGPKRYDWVIVGEGQNDKQGTAVGEWIYLRDRSSLSKLFRDELGIDLGLPITDFGKP